MTDITAKRRRRIWPILLALLAVLAIAFAAWALPNNRLSRLIAVTSFFDADKIVDNFSNVDRAFATRTLDVPIRDDLPRALEPLPETVDIAGTDRRLEDVLAELDTTALVILRDGKVIHEDYRLGTGADDLRVSWSVAKSFMSGMYGPAVESGQIASLDDDITVYVPELAGSAYEGASLRNILSMSSGIRFNENYMDQSSDINRMGRTIALGGSLDDYTTELKERQFEPGSDWQYVSMDTHVAAWGLRRATGKSLHTLFEETYGPMGFKAPPYYSTDGEGVAFALGGLSLTTIDYAKFGQLFLQRGEWNGEQLIPADWVRESTVHSAPAMSDRGVGYGYQWWVPMPEQGDYFAVGIYGQYVYVDPARNIVIAKNAADREFAFADEVGTHSMNKNIEMMRSLSAQLGTPPAPKIGAISADEASSLANLGGEGCSFYQDDALLFYGRHYGGLAKLDGKIVKFGRGPVLDRAFFMGAYEADGTLISLRQGKNRSFGRGREAGQLRLTTPEGSDVTLDGVVACEFDR